MTIKETNNIIENINNQINYYLSFKDLEILKKNNGFYIDENEYEKTCCYINTKLDQLYAKKNNLIKYIEDSLISSKQYDDVKRKIIYYKEQSDTRYTWAQISRFVNYSETQCRRIYRKYKNKRFVD